MPPFAVLHVCMGNICRSPMAERLLRHAVAERVGDQVDELITDANAAPDELARLRRVCTVTVAPPRLRAVHQDPTSSTS